MKNDSGDEGGPSESYKSPTELFKGKLVNLLFECTEHKSKCYNDKNEKYTFASLVWDLSVYLERYTPIPKREELYNWSKQLKNKIKEILNDKDRPTPIEKKDAIIELQYSYAEELHKHNQRILNNSPIIEIETEGELDVDDEETLNIIRLGVRKDDGRVIFKR